MVLTTKAKYSITTLCPNENAIRFPSKRSNRKIQKRAHLWNLSLKIVRLWLIKAQKFRPERNTEEKELNESESVRTATSIITGQAKLSLEIDH